MAGLGCIPVTQILNFGKCRFERLLFSRAVIHAVVVNCLQTARSGHSRLSPLAPKLHRGQLDSFSNQISQFCALWRDTAYQNRRIPHFLHRIVVHPRTKPSIARAAPLIVIAANSSGDSLDPFVRLRSITIPPKKNNASDKRNFGHCPVLRRMELA